MGGIENTEPETVGEGKKSKTGTGVNKANKTSNLQLAEANYEE